MTRGRKSERARRPGLSHRKGVAANRHGARPCSLPSVRCCAEGDRAGSKSCRSRRYRDPCVVADSGPCTRRCAADRYACSTARVTQCLARRRNCWRTRQAERESIRARAGTCAARSYGANDRLVGHTESERSGEQRDEVQANHPVYIGSGFQKICSLRWNGGAGNKYIQRVITDQGQTARRINGVVVRRGCEFNPACIRN